MVSLVIVIRRGKCTNYVDSRIEDAQYEDKCGWRPSMLCDTPNAQTVKYCDRNQMYYY